MFINCPYCGFSREVDEASIPSASTFATCPKCGKRFRFRDEPGQQAAAHGAHPEHAGQPAQAEPEKYHAPEEPMQAKDEDAAAPEPEVSREDAEPAPSEQAKNSGGDIWDSVEKLNERWNKDADDGQEDYAPNLNQEDWGGEDRNPYPRPRRRIPFLSPGGSVAWEVPGGFGTPTAFIATIVTLAKKPKQFFSGINPFSSILPSLIFLVICYIPMFVSMVIAAKDMKFIVNGTGEVVDFNSIASTPELIGLLLFMVVFHHFLSSSIIQLTLRFLEPQKANFRLTLKALAYAKTPVLLLVFQSIGGFLSIFLVVMLSFLSIHHAYKLSWPKTVMALMPYFLLVMLITQKLVQALPGGGQGMPM